MPDVDVLFWWAPWAPLAMHRGFTHGLVGGVLIMPPVLAGLLWLLDRWQCRQTTPAAPALPMRFGWLLALSFLGALTHPLLDLQNVYAVQLLSPLSEHWFHTDGLFIVSPWLLAFLGLGLWRSRRTKSARPALLALAATFGFILLNIGISRLADEALRTSPPYPLADRVFAAPAPMKFWQRDVIWRERGMIGRANYDPLSGLHRISAVQAPYPDHMNEPVVQRAAKATARVRDFLAWAQMPFAQVRAETGCRATVVFHDARFADPAVNVGFSETATVPLSSAECRTSP